MMKKEVWISLLLILAFALFSNQAYSIFLGTCEGYIRNMTGGFVEGANIAVVVEGCSGDGCNGTAVSDSNGYYVVANLNLPAGGTVKVTAVKANAYGENTEAADQFYAAYVNVTLCEAPYPPTLIQIDDTHNNSLIVFEWTAGADPHGYPTYDVWYFDGTEYVNVTSPQNRTNVDFKTYTWGVKTCNQFCCSPYQYDTFEVYNNPPPSPVLVDELDTHNNTVELEWSSGGADPEGDPTYFNLMFDGALYTNVTSPMTFSGLSYGSHTWKVQECDPWDCSSWSVDTFSVTNNAPSEPVLEEINHTSESHVVLRWTSGVDPDGDPTYDEYQFESNAIISPATTPQVESVSGIKVYTWRVRTCDTTGACSNWVQDDFIRFECPTCVCECPPCPSYRRRVSGGKVVYVCLPELICNESWICEEWGPCIDGVQERECIDVNKCNTTCHKPPTIRRCRVEKPMPTVVIGVRKIVMWPFILSAIAFSIVSFAIGVLLSKKWKAKRKR